MKFYFFLLLIISVAVFQDICYAYPSISPYSYCGGNPINYIDPSGEDIVVLNYGNNLTHQHMAMLIQDENGKWQYYSINGDNVYISGKHYGGREFNDLAVGSWDSPMDFFQSEYNMRTETSKSDKSKNHFGFSEGYQIFTTEAQDEIMRNSFVEKAKTRYTPLGNNCATIVQGVLFDANIPVAFPKFEKIHIPANKYFGEPEYNIVRPNFNSLPSSAFKSIMKLNPGGIYIHK